LVPFNKSAHLKNKRAGFLISVRSREELWSLRKEGMNMSKEYKQVSCRDAGADCDFLVRAETEDEIISATSEHACRAHNMCEMSSDLRDKIRSHIKTVWV
jgi:predicted small metal-binding protein